MTERPTSPEPDGRREVRDRSFGVNERRLMNMGYFEALLTLPAVVRTDSRSRDHARSLVRAHEFELAFSVVTSILAHDNERLSDDAYAQLENIAGRFKIAHDDWHGLKRG